MRGAARIDPVSIGVASRAPLAAALLMARVEEAARDLCGDLVRDARSPTPPDLVAGRRRIRDDDAIGSLAFQPHLEQDRHALASMTWRRESLRMGGSAVCRAHEARHARRLCWLRSAQPAYLCRS